MARKNLLPVKLSASQALAADFISPPTIIDWQDNVGYQINITTTDDAGTFKVQASLDFVPPNSEDKANAGTWVDVPISGTPTVAAADDSIMINLNQLPFRAVRLAFTNTTPGTGSADIYIMTKAVGA